MMNKIHIRRMWSRSEDKKPKGVETKLNAEEQVEAGDDGDDDAPTRIKTIR